MVRIALDSAQAAKGAVVQVLADMTALERGNSPYRMATDIRRPTEGPSIASSSTGPWTMYPTSKRAACKRAKARSQEAQGEEPAEELRENNDGELPTSETDEVPSMR